MTLLTVAGVMRTAFPGLRIDAITARGVDGRSQWPEVVAGLDTLEAGAAAGRSLPTEDDSHIASWHEAYRAFGTNPKRERPSVDALRRRLARSGRLPRINRSSIVTTLVCRSLMSNR